MNLLIIARTDWEIVSGITGIVSAVVAIVGLVLVFRKDQALASPSRGRGGTILHYLIFCSAWVSLVIAFNWIVDPFGPLLTEKDERTLYGIMISVPALMLANYALKRLGIQREQTQQKRE